MNCASLRTGLLRLRQAIVVFLRPHGEFGLVRTLPPNARLVEGGCGNNSSARRNMPAGSTWALYRFEFVVWAARPPQPQREVTTGP